MAFGAAVGAPLLSLDPSVPTMEGGAGVRRVSAVAVGVGGLFDALEQERAGVGLGAAERADAPLRELDGRAVERGRPREDGRAVAGARFTMRLMLRRVSSAEAGGLIAENGEADRRHLPNGEGERTPSGLAASSFEIEIKPVGEGVENEMRRPTLPIVSRAGRKVSCFVESAPTLVGVGATSGAPSETFGGRTARIPRSLPPPIVRGSCDA